MKTCPLCKNPLEPVAHITVLHPNQRPFEAYISCALALLPQAAPPPTALAEARACLPSGAVASASKPR